MAYLGLNVSQASFEGCLTQEVVFQHLLTGIPMERCATAIRHARLTVNTRSRPRFANDFRSQLFWRTAGAEYSERASVWRRGHLTNERQTISLPIPSMSPPPVELRLDLTDHVGVVVLHSLRLYDSAGEIIWTWDGQPTSLQAPRAHDVRFRACRRGVTAEIYTDDSWVFLPIPESTLAVVEAAATLIVELSWVNVIDYLRDISAALTD